MGIVEKTYKNRFDPKFSSLCEEIAWKHFHEVEANMNYIIKEIGGGAPPRISTFKLLVNLLNEKGEYAKAIEVCEKALELGLSDGTKGGFEGQIKGMQKLLDKN